MTDEHTPMQPMIRDPKAPVNLLDDFEETGIVTPNSSLSLSDFEDHDASAGEPEELDALGYVDPLNVRPRTSSRVLCLVLGVLLLALSGVAWWLGVCTQNGQSYDDMVESSFSSIVPGWLASVLGVGSHPMVLTVSVAIAVAAVAVAAARKRWWLLGQMAVLAVLCFVASLLKYVLPRPFIIKTVIDNAHNSAPSGHTILAMVSAAMLVLAVPRAWRWVASLAAMAWGLFVGLSVVCGRWHRPTDAVMGTRRSSAGVQIVSAVAITAGLFITAFAGYIIWQVVPGLTVSAAWAKSDAVYSSILLIAGMNAVVFGLLLTVRQLTAAPLSKIGLVGEPPAPPRSRG